MTLTIRNEQDPYHNAEARGRVVEEVRGQEARDHIDELSQKYHGQDYNPDDKERAGYALDRPRTPDHYKSEHGHLSNYQGEETTSAQSQELPAGRPLGELETVAHFDGPMLTGVTVSHRGASS